MAKRLTMFSKLLIVLGIVAALFFGITWVLNNTQMGKNLKADAEKNKTEQEQERSQDNSKTSSSNDSKANKKEGGLFNNSGNSEGRSSDDDVLRVQLVTWPGYAPGLYFNEGGEANTRSRFFKDYGVKVEFIRDDDLLNASNAWAVDEYDVIVQTADAFSFYTAPDEMKELDPRAFIQTDWSRGGDAIIVKRGINTINDLKGKKIALAVPAPAQTMLITALESAGLSYDDVEVITTTDNIKAAELFISPEVDAAVVWSPFDVTATAEVPGSKVLLSTVEQSHIIGDIMLAKNSVIQKKRKQFDAFYKGWMRAVAEMKNAGNRKKAAKYLSEFLQLSVEDAELSMETVYFTGHGDNMNFFGLDKSYKGMKGGDLYNKMNKKFVEIGDNPSMGPNWRNVINTGPILAADSELTGDAYRAEGAKKFTPPTAKEKTTPAISSKPISISFPSGQFALTENAKTIIDIQFAEVAKTFGNVRIRVEGNTDNVGAREMNMLLSEKRANSVAAYLSNTYGMNANRFVIVGNGPDKPVKGCEQNQNNSCKAKNRRTEFQLIPG